MSMVKHFHWTAIINDISVVTSSLDVYGETSTLNVNGTAHFKIVNSCLNTNIYSYLETSGGQSSNLYLNVVHFFTTSNN
jgi:hypothetical protein